MLRLSTLVGALALTCLTVVGCGDPAVETRSGADAGIDGAAGDGSAANADDAADQDGTNGLDVADDTMSDAASGDDASVADAEPSDTGSADTGGDTGGDAASGDDAGPGSAGGDAGGDANASVDDADTTADAEDADGAVAVSDPCGICPWDKQPTGDQPGAKGPHSLLQPKTIDYGTGFLETYKQMLVFQPLVAGPHPVLFLVPGKQLYATGGIIGELGHAYKALCEHVASHGYVVAFVRVEQGLTDGDHARMAKDLLEAQAKLLATVTTADATRIAYAGHSMGGKVVVIAAAEAIAGDKSGTHADPSVVVTMNLSNEPPPLGVYLDATKKAEELTAETKIWFTIIGAGDDTIAPVDAKDKPNSKAVYESLKMQTKQLIVLHGTGKDDPNPTTNPELSDDHSLPLTVNGKVGGIADFGTPPSNLDALDWYGTWKLLVGAMGHVFKGADSAWAYGALRTHGGALPDGTILKHEVISQGWTTLPAP